MSKFHIKDFEGKKFWMVTQEGSGANFFQYVFSSREEAEKAVEDQFNSGTKVNTFIILEAMISLKRKKNFERVDLE